jgi:hypothetical protein
VTAFGVQQGQLRGNLDAATAAINSITTESKLELSAIVPVSVSAVTDRTLVSAGNPARPNFATWATLLATEAEYLPRDDLSR